MPSNNHSPSKSFSLKLLYPAILFSLIGFIDATYLAVKNYTGGPIPCSLLNGCETVITSKYSHIFGVPVSLFGVLYYLALLVLLLIYTDHENFLLIKLAGYMTFVGFLFSIWLVSAQVFLIRSFCLYCLISAVTTTILFVLTRFMLRYNRQTSFNI